MSDLCPTCHSVISPSGNRTKDEDGPGIPVWSGDPMLTPERDPLNGSEYRGSQFIDLKYIAEIQDDRRAKEIELGIDPLTEFTELSPNVTITDEALIIELRISTERILTALGGTLEDYFSTDADGNHQDPGPHDTEKDEWTDVERGKSFNDHDLNQGILLNGGAQFKDTEATVKDTPSMPIRTDPFIRAMHLEDLRRAGLLMGRWEQQSWTIKDGDDWISWSIYGAIAITNMAHQIKPLSSGYHNWATMQTCDNYDADYPIGPVHFHAAGTAQNTGDVNEMRNVGSAEMLMSHDAFSTISYFNPVASCLVDLNKHSVLTGRQCRLKSASKIRFIWSAMTVPYFLTKISRGLYDYEYYGGWVYPIIIVDYRNVENTWHQQIKYGRDLNSYEGPFIEIADGDIVRDAYVDVVSMGGTPTDDAYLSLVSVHYKIGAFTGMYSPVTCSWPAANISSILVDKEMVVDAIVYSTLGNVSL